MACQIYRTLTFSQKRYQMLKMGLLSNRAHTVISFNEGRRTLMNMTTTKTGLTGVAIKTFGQRRFGNIGKIQPTTMMNTSNSSLRCGIVITSSMMGRQTMDVKQLTKQSGCLKPCKHKKYRVIGDPQVEFGDKSLQTDMILSETFIPRDLQILVRVRNLPYSPFLMTQRFILKQDNERKFTKHQVETEELIYPWQSFLAEFGGALGLFLGFSFMTVWDSLVELPVIMGIHYVGSRK